MKIINPLVLTLILLTANAFAGAKLSPTQLHSFAKSFLDSSLSAKDFSQKYGNQKEELNEVLSYALPKMPTDQELKEKINALIEADLPLYESPSLLQHLIERLPEIVWSKSLGSQASAIRAIEAFIEQAPAGEYLFSEKTLLESLQKKYCAKSQGSKNHELCKLYERTLKMISENAIRQNKKIDALKNRVAELEKQLAKLRATQNEAPKSSDRKEKRGSFGDLPRGSQAPKPDKQQKASSSSLN